MDLKQQFQQDMRDAMRGHDQARVNVIRMFLAAFEPAPNDYRVQGIYGGTIQTSEPRSHDLVQAEAVLNRLPLDILYARLDFVRVGGQVSVMEVELIEPIFSFNLVPESIERLVNATRIKL